MLILWLECMWLMNKELFQAILFLISYLCAIIGISILSYRLGKLTERIKMLRLLHDFFDGDRDAVKTILELDIYDTD